MSDHAPSEKTPEGKDTDLEILRQIINNPATYEEILAHLGGQTVYIPLLDRKERIRRISGIYESMRNDGLNHSNAIKAISKRERLTPQHVRIILKGISFP
jgi:Mor family transcriptional regulator